MTSNRSLIRLALKKGIDVDFRIIDFVSVHDDCHTNKNSIKEKLNEMIKNNEIFFNEITKKLKLRGYPIIPQEGKTVENYTR